jgi:hypothetical protein
MEFFRLIRLLTREESDKSIDLVVMLGAVAGKP